MEIQISNSFAYFGFAKLVFDETGILEYDHTNLQYDNLMPVFNQITGGIGTKENGGNPFINKWDVILENVKLYNESDKQDELYGTYRGDPRFDNWAEFHCAPTVCTYE